MASYEWGICDAKAYQLFGLVVGVYFARGQRRQMCTNKMFKSIEGSTSISTRAQA